MKPNAVVHAAAQTLDHQSVAADQLLGGAPTTAAVAVGRFGDLEVGIWEMTPGVMSDTEAEELFIVLSGVATVEFRDGSAPLVLGPGDVVRLTGGTETIWTVTETMRKIYLTGLT